MKRSRQLIFLCVLTLQLMGTCVFLVMNMSQWFEESVHRYFVYQESSSYYKEGGLTTVVPEKELQNPKASQSTPIKPTSALPVPPKPAPTKSDRIKKSRLRRVIRHSEDGNPASVSSTTSINRATVESVLYSAVPIESVHYTSSGCVDTKRNRIDFMKPDWYAQFQYLRELIGKQSPLNETRSLQWSSSAHGETIGNYTKNYAILANACVSPTTGQILFFGDKGRHVSVEARQTLSTPDFYFSPIQTLDHPLPPDQLPIRRNHTAVFHPRSFQNIYHFFEGSSQLIRMAMHPELFPPMGRVVMGGQSGASPQQWSGFMDFVYLDLFAPSRRPTMHFMKQDLLSEPRKPFCDSLLLVMRNWDSDGAGNFVPEPLGVDLFRAAAYHRAGVSPRRKEKGEKLCLLQIRRVNKRRVLNEEAVFEKVKEMFVDRAKMESKVLEKESAADQVRRFMELDVLLAAHGAGLTNTIFMLPNSYLIELMPPHWYLACYRRMAENAGLGYRMIRSQGKKGPQCDVDPKSVACQRAGIRDRDFNVSVSEVVEEVGRGLYYVKRKKYKL